MILVLFIVTPIYSEHIFLKAQNSIEGEIYSLRKQVETPIEKQNLYDLHHREFHLFKNEWEFSLEKETYDQNRTYQNWTLVLPINEQSFLHFIEANQLWEKKMFPEALFLYKSIFYSSNKETFLKSRNALQNITKDFRFKEFYKKIDPYFLYFLEKNQTKLFSDIFGFKMTFPYYWNLVFTKKNQWFYFIENSTNKRIFSLTNGAYDLYFYIIKSSNQIKTIEDFSIGIDKEFSWSTITKKNYNFKREKINDTTNFVSYTKENRLISYYELLFMNPLCFVYIRVYSKNKEDKNIYELLNAFTFE
ncbi:MAG: hypothetical protein ACK4UJ_10520 [Leptonema sp. (in: bacteria)]